MPTTTEVVVKKKRTQVKVACGKYNSTYLILNININIY